MAGERERGREGGCWALQTQTLRLQDLQLLLPLPSLELKSERAESEEGAANGAPAPRQASAPLPGPSPPPARLSGRENCFWALLSRELSLGPQAEPLLVEPLQPGMAGLLQNATSKEDIDLCEQNPSYK